MRKKGTLKQWRMFAGLTRSELAVCIKKSESTIQNWESGKYQPNARDIEMLEKVLQVDWSDVILVQKGLR